MLIPHSPVVLVVLVVLVVTTLYQAIATVLDNRRPPPGRLVDIDGGRLHLQCAGDSGPSIVLDHSLGGIEGYFLLKRLAKLGRACIYDRAGYGWSDSSPLPRSSVQIVAELDALLQHAEIPPPYILVGDSFGSYNVRLYAHLHPENVAGIVLTDPLHESGMLAMPPSLKALKFFFLSGFILSVLASMLGFVRILCDLGAFELLKPELRGCSPESLRSVKRSFCGPRHWLTMVREISCLDTSARQLIQAGDLDAFPVVTVRAASFFRPSAWTALIPLGAADRLRRRMHADIAALSSDPRHLDAAASGHFVWLDQPGIIADAVASVIEELDATGRRRGS